MNEKKDFIELFQTMRVCEPLLKEQIYCLVIFASIWTNVAKARSVNQVDAVLLLWTDVGSKSSDVLLRNVIDVDFVSQTTC